ncbi:MULTISPECIES: hypothetical protein [unclassified Agrococcus]|uniref:hypothetical protein n=1 Tax=unclassified Agrococcus TaxID=2615065 RepID=UPI003615627B
MTDHEMLTMREAMAEVGRGESTIFRWQRDGLIRFRLVRGKMRTSRERLLEVDVQKRRARAAGRRQG